jgi:hypothetical protein
MANTHPIFFFLSTICQQLAKGADIEPCSTRQICFFFLVFLLCKHRIRSGFQAPEFVYTVIIGLNENGLARFHESVADFSLDADVLDFPKSIVIYPGPISIQRISVRIGVIHPKD